MKIFVQAVGSCFPNKADNDEPLAACRVARDVCRPKPRPDSETNCSPERGSEDYTAQTGYLQCPGMLVQTRWPPNFSLCSNIPNGLIKHHRPAPCATSEALNTPYDNEDSDNELLRALHLLKHRRSP